MFTGTNASWEFKLGIKFLFESMTWNKCVVSKLMVRKFTKPKYQEKQKLREQHRFIGKVLKRGRLRIL